MSMINDTGDEPRVDGQHLAALREPGSDALLSPEVRKRIEEIVRDWVDDGGAGETGGMSEQGQDPKPVDPAPAPDEGEDDREREERERRAGERDDDDTEGDPAGV
jgi:hypothetical protein